MGDLPGVGLNRSQDARSRIGHRELQPALIGLNSLTDVIERQGLGLLVISGVGGAGFTL